MEFSSLSIQGALVNGLSHSLSNMPPACLILSLRSGRPFKSQCPQKTPSAKSTWRFLAGALGLEFQVSGIYGIFETFIRTKQRFCIKYPIISNCSFYIFSLKGNDKGKIWGNARKKHSKITIFSSLAFGFSPTKAYTIRPNLACCEGFMPYL